MMNSPEPWARYHWHDVACRDGGVVLTRAVPQGRVWAIMKRILPLVVQDLSACREVPGSRALQDGCHQAAVRRGGTRPPQRCAWACVVGLGRSLASEMLTDALKFTPF
jgi:hypothetical protein